MDSHWRPSSCGDIPRARWHFSTVLRTAPQHVFTGDSLFPGGVGNTEKDPERFASLFNDVHDRLFGYLPDDTVIHPGHGKGTSLGAERPHLDAVEIPRLVGGTHQPRQTWTLGGIPPAGALSF